MIHDYNTVYIYGQKQLWPRSGNQRYETIIFTTDYQRDSYFVGLHKMFLCVLSLQDNMVLSSEIPLCAIPNLIITLLVQHPSKTKFTKCLAIKTNKRLRSITQAKKRLKRTYLFSSIRVQEKELCIVFYMFFPSLSFFTACPQGTFKSSQGAGLCQQCPLNSRSTIEAATLCGCRNGYYRGDMDKPEDMCTSESVSVKRTHTQTNKNKSFSTLWFCDYASVCPIQVCEVWCIPVFLDWSHISHRKSNISSLN